MTAVDDLTSSLHKHPFFQGLAGQLRTLLEGCAVQANFPPQAYLFREGVDADRFFLIRRGLVAVEVAMPAHPPVIVQTVGEGDVLGWSWLVPPYRTAFAARAQVEVESLAFDTRCLRAAMEAYPELGYAVTKRLLPVMAQRLTSARLQMLDLYGPAAKP